MPRLAPLNRPRLRLLAAVAASIALLALWGHRFLSDPGDFRVYAGGGQRMLMGDPVYLRAHDPRLVGDPFTYPPLFALVFVPFWPLRVPVQHAVWLVVSFGCLAGLLWAVHRTVMPWIGSQSPPRIAAGASAAFPLWGFWGLVALLVARYVQAGFQGQTHDVIVVLLVALSAEAGARGRETRCGIAAGLAVACKATPLLFAPVFLGQRRFRAAAWLAAAAVAATLLPDLLLPAKSGEPWVVGWYNTCLRGIGPGKTAYAEGGWSKWNELNQCLAGTVYRLSVSPNVQARELNVDVRIWNPGPRTLWATTLALQAGVLLLLARAAWPPRRVHELTPADQSFLRFGQAGAVAAAMVLLSPMSSKPHFIALLLPAAFCLAHFLYRRRDPLVGGLLAAMFLLSTLTAKGIVGKALGDRLVVGGSVCWTALICLVATLRVISDFRGPGLPSGPAPGPRPWACFKRLGRPRGISENEAS